MQRWFIRLTLGFSLLFVAWSGPTTAQARGCQAFGAHVASDAAANRPLGLFLTESGFPPLNDEAAAEQAAFCG